MTSNATVVSSQAYGNGTYNATEPTAQSNTSTIATFRMFDNDINTYYEQNAAPNGVYTTNYYYNSGTSNGANSPTTTISGQSAVGWWVQRQNPTSFILRNYTIVGRQDGNWWTNRAPDTFWIAGSTDGSTWSNVHFQSGATYPQLGTNFTVPLTSNSLPYSYYRMVVSKLNGNSDILNIASWNLYGDSPSYTTGSSDFYADRLGNLLTAPVTGQSLSDWLGGATGYVATWYNQMNPLNNVSQTTDANQPTISPGVINFNGVNQWFSNTATTGGLLANGQQKYSYAACFNSANAGVGSVCDTNARVLTVSAAGRMILIGGQVGFNGESNDQHNMTAFTPGTQKSVVMMIDNTQVNNITTESSGVTVNKATENPGGLNLSNYWFGIGRKMSSGVEYFSGSMKSVMVFNSALSASDAAIIDAWQLTL
jgi:hypothetical protein